MFVPFGGLPRFVNRWGWNLFGALVESIVRAPINEQRALLGLAPADAAIPVTFAEPRAVLAADPEIAPWPADIRGAVSPTGWLSLPDHRELGASLESFLDAGPPPIYFGFGSMVARDPARTTAIVLEAARAVKCRALISAGWAGLGSNDSLGPDALMIGSVPHAKLFSRVATVVHHGGAGTTHAAARAGVPQIVVPHLLDQFSWARRVASLGVGPKPLPRWQLSSSRLVARLEACLRDREITRRAVDLAKPMNERDGVAALVGFLEQRVANGRGSQRPAPSRPAPSPERPLFG
jgi:vancomycin aglycone glucosyltransferase